MRAVFENQPGLSTRAAAFTVSVIEIAVVVLVIVTLIRGLRVSIGRIAGA